MSADEGEDVDVWPWVIEYGRWLAPVIVVQCLVPAERGGWLWLPVLHRDGLGLVDRVGNGAPRPAPAPGWQATYQPAGGELLITHPSGTAMYTGQLDGLPERWLYAARELHWCVVVATDQDVAPDGEHAGFALLNAAAAAGRVVAGRMPLALD